MKRRDTERTQAAELVAIAEALSATLLSATVPLYQVDARDQPEVVGSGVLIQISGIRFLVTAGHILDLRKNGQLLVGASPDFLTIAGRPSRWRSIAAVKSTDDKIDVGVVRLGGGPWDTLPLERFLKWDAFDTEIPVMARQTYALVGFPHSVNRKAIIGDRIKAAAFRFAGLECEQEAYNGEQIDPQQNVMIGFEKNAMWDAKGRRNAPDLYGSSGCGLWRFGRRIRESTRPPKLSAIATEWHPKGRHRYVLGTRITFVLGALADKYEDVQRYVDQKAK